MINLSTKYILANSEFSQTPLGEFFLGLGFKLTQDLNEKNIYFAIDDFQFADTKYPTLNTSTLDLWKKSDRLYVNVPEFNPELVKLFENYFNQKDDIDLVERYSKEFKEIYTLKLMDSLNCGYIIDTVVVEAYKHDFKVNEIRNYLNESLKYFYKMSEERGVTLPLDFNYSHDENTFALSISIFIEKFNENTNLLNDIELIKSLVNHTNFCDVTFLVSRGKLTITALWLKQNPELKSFFINKVGKRTKAQRYEHSIELADLDNEIKYRPNYASQKQDLTLLGLARRIAMYIKSNHKDNADFLNNLNLELVKIEAKTYPIVSEIEDATDEVYLKVIQLLKTDNQDELFSIGGRSDSESFSQKVSGDLPQDIEQLRLKRIESDGQHILNLEKKVLEYEIKNTKLNEQYSKLKKLVEQMKAEYLKLKIAKNINNFDAEKESSISLIQSTNNNSKLIELAQELDKVKSIERNLLKDKSDLENTILARDVKINLLEQKIENFKKEFFKSKEYNAQEKVLALESEIKVLNAKNEILSKSLQNISNSTSHRESDLITKKDKELDTLKTQLHMLQSLIAKIKKEKLEEEEKMRGEIVELKNSLNKNKVNHIENIVNNITHSNNKNTSEENHHDEKYAMLFSEKKILDDKFKDQGLEIKKLEHKIKILSSQLEEATKKKGRTEKGASNSNEAYIKQLELANKKVLDSTLELTEKKKEILKLKQDNGQLITKLTELERKLANLEKKAA